MNCPQCGADNNEENVYCGKCAAILHEPKSVDEPTEYIPGNLAHSKKPFYKLWWVWGIIATGLIVGVFLIFNLFQNDGHVTKDNMGVDAIYNKNLGVGIRLLMQKSEIDKILGSPDISTDSYEYGDGADWISISYEDGKAVSIFSVERNWILYKNIGENSKQDEAMKVFGKDCFTGDSSDDLYYFYDKNKNSISDMESVKSGEGVEFMLSLSFRSRDDTLSSIHICTYDYLYNLE